MTWLLPPPAHGPLDQGGRSQRLRRHGARHDPASESQSEPAASSSADRWQEKFLPNFHQSFARTAWHPAYLLDVAVACAGQPRTPAYAPRWSGASCHWPSRGGAWTIIESRSQLERQDDQSDTEHERKGAKPPSEDDRAGQGCEYHQDAEGRRRRAAQHEPPAAIVGANRRGEHQTARDDRPGGDEQHEGEDSEPGPEKSKNRRNAVTMLAAP